MDHHVKDLGLVKQGRQRIEWAEIEMPVLRSIVNASRASGRWPVCASPPACT